MRASLILGCICFPLLIGAQPEHTYEGLVAKAALAHLQKNHQKAITYYEIAFGIQQPDALAAYKAAGVYALSGNRDKAFMYLQQALSVGWYDAEWLSIDPYFDFLKKQFPSQWANLEQQAIAKEQLYMGTLKMPALRKEINSMTLNDQKLRFQQAQAQSDSLAQAISRQIAISDSNNTNHAKSILKQYGWPTISQIGEDGQNNLWLIVQHSDQDIQFQRAALLAMEKLKGTKELNLDNFAFLYDRIRCNLNNKQVYGTQVVWSSNGEASAFRPIENESNADELRGQLGLVSLEIYALNYGFVYHKLSSEQYKRRDSIYNAHVRSLIDSAKFFYIEKQFQKTYDYYNTASTFLSGMSDEDSFDAAVIFSKIASETSEAKYASIALDFLDLMLLRGSLRKKQLSETPVLQVLRNNPRWSNINSQLR